MAKLQTCHDVSSSHVASSATVENLGDLIKGLAADFGDISVLVDGLDKRGETTEDVVETLASPPDTVPKIKILLSSRDHIEIREQLNNFQEISVAARDEDLELYVASEIENRIRKRRLRLKPRFISLKDDIIE